MYVLSEVEIKALLWLVVIMCSLVLVNSMVVDSIVLVGLVESTVGSLVSSQLKLQVPGSTCWLVPHFTASSSWA